MNVTRQAASIVLQSADDLVLKFIDEGALQSTNLDFTLFHFVFYFMFYIHLFLFLYHIKSFYFLFILLFYRKIYSRFFKYSYSIFSTI